MAKKKPAPRPGAASRNSAPHPDATNPAASGGRPALLNAGRAALFFALVLSVYLLTVALTGSHAAGCEEGQSCHSVLGSKWAKLFGIPISALGLGAYLGMLGLSFTRGMGPARVFLAVTIVGGALWFTGVQAFVLKTFCPWCCATHALAAIGTVLVMFGIPRGTGGTARRGQTWVAGAGATVALLLTAIAQFKAPDPQPVTVTVATEEAAVKIAKERRTLIDVHDTFQLSTVELPALGDAQTAEHVAVGIFDFSCIHCRHLMKLLKPVVAGYGSQLAVLKLPGYYNDNGREIQKLMLPVFREAPEVYEALGNQLYDESIAAEVATVRQELERRLGSERLQQILAAYGPWAAERVTETKALLEANRAIINSGKLPQLIVGKTIESGNKTSAGHYHQLFAANFGISRENAPEIACSPAKLELGRVVAYSEHSLTMTLSNPGKVPVTIDGIKRPKGIVIDEVPKYLAPGAAQTVTARLTVPAQGNGDLSTFFEVHSDAAEPVLRIPFTANVLGIKIDPPVLNFAVMEAGGDPQELTATVTLEEPARIVTASCPIRFFAPSAVEEIEPNRVYRIRVTAAFEQGITGFRNSYASLVPAPLDSTVPWPAEIRIPIRARVVAKKAQ